MRRTAALVLGVRACAGARGGMVLARGRGFEHGWSPAGPWVDITLHGGPRVRFGEGPFWFDLIASVSVPIMRDTFAYQDPDGFVRGVHRAARIIGGLELGAGYFF